MQIRTATKADAGRILELVHELALYERAPEEVTVSLEDMIEAGFGANPVWWALVAEVNGRVEGFALYYIRYSTWKGCRMYLEDLYITESLRKHGIGQQLFDALIAEGKAKNLNGMVWQVLEWNTPAIEFYKKNKATLDPEWWNGSISFDSEQ